MRLGEGEFGAASVLQPAAMERALLVCRTFVELAKTHDAQAIVGVAAAATREARNRNAFVRRLRDEAGLPVHVLSGKEEARLIFLGVLTKVNLGERRGLVVDIGGGSTEIALGDATGADHVDSLSVGSIRPTSEFPEVAQGPISADVFESMRRRVQIAAARSRRMLSGERVDSAYGTSETIRNLIAAAARLRGTDDERSPDVLHRPELKKAAKLLRSTGFHERRAILGLNPDRADIIVAGAAILDAVMEELGVAEIRALADCGLREGLVLDYVAREAGIRSGQRPSLGAKCPASGACHCLR